MRRVAIPAFVGLALIGGVACSGDPSTGDFKDKAEDFIEDDLAEQAQLEGITFNDASCDDPTSVEVGTAYSCTATGSDGETYTFGVSIAGERELSVDSIDPIPASLGATTATTVAG